MINFNQEGLEAPVPQEDELTMEEKEDNLSLHEYLILREKAKIALLSLEDLDQDLNVTLQKGRLQKEIEALNEKIEELGGEEEIAA